MPANTYGRQVVIAAANKSGGQLILGDVGVVDTTNNLAFTTSTAGSVTNLVIGIAMETIANNATGRFLISGYASLVNVNASVTRGNYGKTYTVAKQATDAGASRVAGTFCQFLTGGTTPDAIVYPSDLGGASLTNPMTTGGDIIYGGASGTPTRLANGSSGQHLNSTGSTTAPTWTYPPGYEFDYAQITSGVTVTATTEGAAQTVVDGNAVTYDGSTIVLIEFYCDVWYTSTTATADAFLLLFDGATDLGIMASIRCTSASRNTEQVHASRRLTPSAGAHTYHVKAYSTASGAIVDAGAGNTTGASAPAFIRITKAA